MALEWVLEFYLILEVYKNKASQKSDKNKCKIFLNKETKRLTEHNCCSSVQIPHVQHFSPSTQLGR